AQNDTNGAIVALASPYLNKQIHEMTNGDSTKDKAVNLAAHALLSAVEFQLTGKDPLTGAVAGVTGEATATLLTKALYDKTPAQLTASEKENISTLSQLAGGLAGALTAKANGTTAQQGGTFLTATAGAETAKRAVENNYLFKDEAARKYELEQKARKGIITPAEREELAGIYKVDRERDIRLVSSCSNKMSATCREESKKVDSAMLSYTGAELNHSYAYPVYTRYSTKYGEDYKKATSFSEEYSILTASKEKAYADFETRFDLPKGSVNQFTQWGEVIANTVGLIGTSNIDKSALSGDFSKPLLKNANANNSLPTISRTTDYELTDFKANIGRSLIYQENIGGHTITRHVGKTDSDLITRLNQEPNLKMASSFTNVQIAEKAISEVIAKNNQEVAKFMVGNKARLVITDDVGFNVGKIVNRQSLSSNSSSKATVVIIKDNVEPKGWRILTAFPDK
ncbi:RNase A-like domain-containing protein, partial [Rodentibacter trehalosifermentans]